MTPVSRFLFICTLFSVVVATASARARFSYEELTVIDKKWPTAVATTTGLRYVVEREGSGKVAKSGDLVRVLYRGELFDGKVFDEAADPQHPLVTRLGRGELILGWEEALTSMRVGEKRTLLVPSDLAYGARGKLPTIPRQASLIFQIELISIEPPVEPAAETTPAVK
jgi:FKBP-type peptidyl-prolyl cis-trans isomerase